MAAQPGPPALSVVVIGRNEGGRLVRCLESVRRMTPIGGPVEVLYVDSDSTDDSAQRARPLASRVIELHPARPCAALGRNAGWRAARAELVLFLDGDTILHPDFVAASLAEFAEDAVAVVWGHRREIHPERSVYNRVLDLDWIHPPGETEFCGGDALMRRSALELVGGFDDGLVAGEEPELCQRLRARGWKIVHVDRPMTGHDLAITGFVPYCRRARRTGHAYAEIAERFRRTDTPLWTREARHNRLHAAALLALAVGAPLAAAVGASPTPLVIGVAIAALLVLRTAARTRARIPPEAAGPGTRLLHAVHSHVQQIPIALVQIHHILERRTGRRRHLAGYKKAPVP